MRVAALPGSVHHRAVRGVRLKIGVAGVPRVPVGDPRLVAGPKQVRVPVRVRPAAVVRVRPVRVQGVGRERVPELEDIAEALAAKVIPGLSPAGAPPPTLLLPPPGARAVSLVLRRRHERRFDMARSLASTGTPPLLSRLEQLHHLVLHRPYLLYDEVLRVTQAPGPVEVHVCEDGEHHEYERCKEREGPRPPPPVGPPDSNPAVVAMPKASSALRPHRTASLRSSGT